MFANIRKLMQHAFIYGLGHIVTRAVGFILLPLFTHTLNQEDFGVLSLLLSYIAAMTILYGFGIDSAFLRYYVLADSASERHRIFSTAYWFITAVAVGLSMLQLFWAKPLAALILGDSTHAQLLLMCAGILCFDALAAFPFLLFRAEERSHLFALNKFLNVAMHVGLSCFFLLKLQRGLPGVLEANLLASAFTFVILLPVSARRLHFSMTRSMCAKLAQYGLPYLPSTLGIVAIDNMDRYILNALTDLKTVGLYSAGYRLGIVMGLLIAAFRFAWLPFSLNVSRTEHARALYARVLTYFIVVCCFFFLLISFFIDDLVRLRFGNFTLIAPEYWPATVIVPIILLGYLCYGVFVNLLVGIHIKEKTLYLPLLTGAGVVVNAALNFALIPKFGMLGAAWATAMAYAAMSLWGFFVAQRIYPVAYEWRRILIAGTITTFLFFSQQLWSWHALASVGLLLSFPPLLWFSGFFEKSEVARLKSVLAWPKRELPQ